MNEFFAAEPSACQTEAELRLLLGYFGPFAGRYLAAYPKDWFRLAETSFSHLGELHQERIKTLLRRAREGSMILSRSNLAWDDRQDWVNNAASHVKVQPPVFQSLITATHSSEPEMFSFSVSDLDLPPTAEERIAGTPSEYSRVCRTLLVISPELHFIDPYLDLTKKDVSAVLTCLLETAATGKCRSVKLWARYSKLVGNKDSTTVKHDLTEKLRSVVSLAKLPLGTQVVFELVWDDDRQSKMHGRYLLSVKGGIRFDQGFQQLPEGRKVDVGPLGKQAFEDLATVYLDGRNDFKHMASITIRV